MAYIGKSPSQGVRSRFQYQATAGQDSFSGSDANGLTLTYTDSLYMDVYQNGILLVPGDDYTATTGTTVVLVQSASLDDIIEMVVYDVFSVPDAVSQSAGGTFSGNVTMGNNLTVNSDVTVGDGSAADKKILFDGNAQDYHIGLDDSADSLIIGKGSALGTTTSMAINADGIITKPLQPAFLITNNALQENPASEDTVVFGTEVFDQNNDVSSNTFTAPVTGRYFLNAGLRIDNMSSGNNHHSPLILTSNREFRNILELSSDITYHHFHMSALADMDAGDTAVVKFKQSGSTGGADIPSDAQRTHFSGFLVA